MQTQNLALGTQFSILLLLNFVLAFAKTFAFILLKQISSLIVVKAYKQLSGLRAPHGDSCLLLPMIRWNRIIQNLWKTAWSAEFTKHFHFWKLVHAEHWVQTQPRPWSCVCQYCHFFQLPTHFPYMLIGTLNRLLRTTYWWLSPSFPNYCRWQCPMW